MLQTALKFSHQLLTEIVTEDDLVIDATMGNGNDTLFLANLVGDKGKVYSFDIQQQALEKTKTSLLEKNLLARVQLILTGHENISKSVPQDQKIKACIFNLGYLPKSNKQTITLPKTTRAALDSCLKLLLPKGRIIVVSYYGHDGGLDELEMLNAYCQSLPQEEYSVLKYQFINQKNQPPVLFCIESKRK